MQNEGLFSFENMIESFDFTVFDPDISMKWDESQQFMPELDCLRPEEIRKQAEIVGLTETELNALLGAAVEIKQHHGLARLFRHSLFHLIDGTVMPKLKKWPTEIPPLETRSGLFYLLLAMALVPRIHSWHQSLGLPEKITRDTCQQIQSFCNNYRRGHNGLLGVYVNQLSWLSIYPRERYFRLGGFEYRLKMFNSEMQVWRHNSTGQVVALAKNGSQFTNDGYIAYADYQEKWTSRITQTNQSVTGFPISPYGTANSKEVTLLFSEWQQVLKSTDIILDMHIPQGGGMTPAACKESHRLAFEFFKQYFPAEEFKAIVCHSWLFNTQLEEILPPESNLVQYMRNLYLFPVPSNGQDGLWFIFLQEPLDLSTAPCETSLQRSVLDFLKKGSRWRSGGMFLLRENILKFGTQHYRSNWKIP